MSDAYRALESRHHRLAGLAGALRVLEWDRAAMMPEGGAGARAEQLATLRVVMHEHETDPRVEEWLDAAESSAAGLSDWQVANLREMRRAWRHASAVPRDLVEALSRHASRAELAWRSARAADDFARLAPSLEALLATVREVAEAKSAALACSPYDALLDVYDPGRTSRQVDVLFAELEAFLPALLSEVLERQASGPPVLVPRGPFPAERQRALGKRVMRRLGFDFAHGRLDVSHHPFTGGVPEDVRITTRYAEDDFAQALMAVVHETGHAQYERGLPERWRGQPVGQSRGMTLHESQSLLLEMQAGRSLEFARWLAPMLREELCVGGPAWEADNLVRRAQRVARGLIRVDADEVSYPLHVILRTRLERAMIAGDLRIRELPGAWNEGMQHLLGVAPDGDARGCLQDIHWPAGAFGYFPTYTLGALAAAQLFAAARREHPGIPEDMARGDFSALRAWLGEHVHARGCRHGSEELIERASGAPLGTSAFEAHLRARYLEFS